MKLTIAIAGKGGIGKTTLSALFVRVLKEMGIRPILAVDADPNSNLAEALGVEPGRPLAEIREQSSSPEGSPPGGIGRVRALEDEIQRTITEADGFDLITMGRPEGPRCYCYVNNLLRKFLDTLSRNYAAVVVDNEAGMEHLSRRTTNDVDFLIAVMNPTLPVAAGGPADRGPFPRVAGEDRTSDWSWSTASARKGVPGRDRTRACGARRPAACRRARGRRGRTGGGRRARRFQPFRPEPRAAGREERHRNACAPLRRRCLPVEMNVSRPKEN